jgi:hypothetical protein
MFEQFKSIREKSSIDSDWNGAVQDFLFKAT